MNITYNDPINSESLQIVADGLPPIEITNRGRVYGLAKEHDIQKSDSFVMVVLLLQGELV
jgi:hypothetical protein